MKQILLILVILFCHNYSLEAAMSNEKALSLFVEGNLAYREGRYEEAVAKYEEIVSSGKESGNLYYNLGNGYLKLNQVGKAILNYERAKDLMPRDSDLNANYKLALMERQGVSVSSRRPLWQRFIEALGDFCTINEIFGLALLLGGLLALCHLCSLYGEWPRKIYMTLYTIMGGIFVLLALIFILSLVVNNNQAVIIADAEAKFEPREEATTYFDLKQGHKVRIIKPISEWYKIERPDGKKGWLLKDKLEEI